VERSFYASQYILDEADMPVVLRVKGYRFWFYEADLDEPPHVHRFAARLHAKRKAWKGEAFGWPAEYNPSRPETPLDSKMSFTPADFCIGESGIWFFSLMWEHGDAATPVEFLDSESIMGIYRSRGATMRVHESRPTLAVS
jgi:hypothetical protein